VVLFKANRIAYFTDITPTQGNLGHLFVLLPKPISSSMKNKWYIKA
jgi:hypothetical protein